jgi:hypothetical protein
MFTALIVPPQTLVVGPIAEVLKRGESPTATLPPLPFYTGVAAPTPTVATAAMSSSSSAQGNP